MCHDWWSRRDKRREERFEEELRYLLDEDPVRPPRGVPVVEHEPEQEPAEPERLGVEAGAS